MHINQYIDGKAKEMTACLAELVRIKSVKAPAKEGMPFGQGVARALEYALECADRLGLKTVNHGNYIGIAEYGQGEKTLGVLVHLDVVPEGGGWSVPPYEAIIKGGKMLGRGVSDDKGPAVASLYALAALKQLGVALNKKVQILLGCDEESGWGDIEYFTKHCRLPDMAFSPDADYPVVNAEKGIQHVMITRPLAGGESGILSLEAGTRPNVVAPYAKARVRLEKHVVEPVATAAARGTGTVVKLRSYKGDTIINVAGTGAHASNPEKGNNAITALLEMLAGLPLPKAGIKAVLPLRTAFSHGDFYGKALGIGGSDEVSGSLTQNPGLLRLSSGRIKLCVDLRCPVTADMDEILSGIIRALPGYEVRRTHSVRAHYVPENSPLVRALLKAYGEQSGKEAYCLSMGGGTYARAIENAVSFGCVFPGEDARMHMPDEVIDLGNFVLNAKILAHAIVEVCNNA